MGERRLVILTVLGAALLAALAGSIQVFDHDAWMHLAAGRLILDSGLPSTNSFAWTFPDHPWKDVEWLFDLLTALFHGGWGWRGVSLLQALLLACTFALAWDTLRRQARGGLSRFLPWGGALLLLVLAESRYRFNHRPETATLLFLALTLWLWERRPRLLPLWLFLAGAAWVNLHPGILFGAAVCAAYTLSDRLRDGPRALLPGMAATGAFLAGTLLNPHLLYPYRYLWENATGISPLDLSELRHPTFVQHPVLFLLALFALAAVVHRLRHRDWSFALLVTIFLPAALFAQRLAPLLLLVTLPGVGRALDDLLDTLKGRARILAPLALLIPLAAGAWQVAAWSSSYRFGWGANPYRVPEQVVRVIRERGLTGRIYNEYGVGSTLMAELPPGQKVFLDSRTFAYPFDFIRQATAWRSKEEFSALLERWRCDLAVLQWEPEVKNAFVAGMLEEMGWRLVVYEGVFRLYVRPGSPDQQRLSDLAFRRLGAADTPRTLGEKAALDPGGMVADLRRIDPARLLAPLDLQRFGSAALAAGDAGLGEAFFRRFVALHPKTDLAWFNLAVALKAQGRREEAREAFGKAARLTRDADMRMAAEAERD